MNDCWASVLGDCSGPLSGEHVVTASWYGVKSVTVSGMPWCRDSPKTVGVASLKAKILCSGHNSRLSPVDTAGKHACETLDSCMDLGRRRNAGSTEVWPITRFPVDGPLFERWLVKTVINLLVARDLSVVNGAVVLESPPERLVRVAFGLETMPVPTGVYVAFRSDEAIGPKDNITIGILADPNVGLLAILFSIQGFRFLLWLGLQPPPASLELPGIMEIEWQLSHLRRHLAQLAWNVNGKLSHFIDFGWPDQPMTDQTSL